MKNFEELLPLGTFAFHEHQGRVALLFEPNAHYPEAKPDQVMIVRRTVDEVIEAFRTYHAQPNRWLDMPPTFFNPYEQGGEPVIPIQA